jgi:hypothetical protein
MEMTISSRTQTKGMDSEDVSPRTDIISGRDYYHFKAKTSKQHNDLHSRISFADISALERGRHTNRRRYKV